MNMNILNTVNGVDHKKVVDFKVWCLDEADTMA